MKDKEKQKLLKERKKTAGGETKREDPKREISKYVSKNPRTDSDDNDIDLDYRWETITPTILPRAELIEIVEEETAEPAEEVFHGFEQREVDEALELQAIFRENNVERTKQDKVPEIDLSMETEEIVGTETEESPKRRENLSPRERKRRKAAARAC